MSRAVLAADVHLSVADPATAGAFLQALPQVAAGAQRLFLLGDLFDAWIGDDVAGEADAGRVDAAAPGDDRAAAADDSLAREVAAALRRLADAGTAIALGRGNRDFLLGERYAAACGAVLLPEPAVVRLAGRAVLLVHGDELCTGDVDYQVLRAQLRAPAWQAAFLAQPRGVRAAAARRLRGQSESAKRDKPDDIMDVDAEAVAALMRAHGVRELVHGHTHRPGAHAFSLDGQPAMRRVLPDWDAATGRGGFLVADDDGWERIDAFARH